MIIIRTAFDTLAFNHHVRPECLRSISRITRIRNDNLHQPNPILKLKTVTSVDTITPGFSPPAVPHHGTSHWFQPTPYGNPCGFELFSGLYTIMWPSLPLSQPTHYSLHVYDLKDHYHVGETSTEVGRGTRFIRVEDRDDLYYWITCCMDNTGVRISMRVGRDLVIDPNPQDILSRLARVGSLMWLWWDIFLNSFDGPNGCNIGDWEGRCEMRGRDKRREG